ncbi:hypothetical protein BJX63DRAFT_62927 [Aspergillus granulosus]|uniref:Uncharacterized protein n=1 Tax=Aspergillus granulosus TaxID=176169 RepID=A0ABR4GWV6_9EURO
MSRNFFFFFLQTMTYCMSPQKEEATENSPTDRLFGILRPGFEFSDRLLQTSRGALRLSFLPPQEEHGHSLRERGRGANPAQVCRSRTPSAMKGEKEGFPHPAMRQDPTGRKVLYHTVADRREKEESFQRPELDQLWHL